MQWRTEFFLCPVATWIFVPIPLTHTLGWKLKNPSTIYNCHIITNKFQQTPHANPKLGNNVTLYLLIKLYQGRYIKGTAIFMFSFCIGLVTQLNGSALEVLKHHYITKRIRELLIGNSRFLIYNSLNQLLYHTIQKKVALSWLNLRKFWA